MLKPRPLIAALLVVTAAVSGSNALATTTRPPRVYPTGPTYEHFWVYASGSQVTRWSQPAQSIGDCYYHETTKPRGSEVVRFRAPRRKLLAINYGISTLFHIGSWDPQDFRPSVWLANGTTHRVDDTTVTYGPGACGYVPPGPAAKDDCSPTRLRHWDVSLDYQASVETLGLRFEPLRRFRDGARGRGFDRCEVQTPSQATADTISSTDVSFPSKDLFAGHGKHIVVARQTWRTPAGSLAKATTTVRWTLILVRHR